MWDELIKLLESNQLFQGGFVLMLVGALLAYARNVPKLLYAFLKRKLVYHIQIESRDSAFVWVIKWLHSEYPNKKIKKLIALTYFENNTNFENNTDKIVKTATVEHMPKVYFKPNSCYFLIRFKGKLLLVHVNREKIKSEGGNILVNFHETISLHFFSKNGKKLAKELIDTAYTKVKKNEDPNKLKIFYNNWADWNLQQKLYKRYDNSIYLEKNIYESIHLDLKWFLNNREWYIKRGVPYRRGYLLYGPPGNGKTSLIHVLASEFNYDIYTIALSNGRIDANNLSQLFFDLPPNGLVVFEDIDSGFDENRKPIKDGGGDSYITFSGFLNILCGFSSNEGRIVFMTSNYKNRLDPALLRPGRIDYQVELKNGTKHQMNKMFETFYPELNSNHKQLINSNIKDYRISMAKFQEHLLSNHENGEKALKTLSKILVT